MTTNAPILFILSGLPASGKSTLSKGIAKAYNAIYLRIDTIEQRLRDVCYIQVQEEGYKLAHSIASDNLRLGLSVVADSCNLVSLSRADWEAVATANGCAFINIEVVCSDKEEHRKRAETRKVEIENHQLPDWKAIENRECHPWHRKRIQIDTAGKSIEDTERELHRRIREYLTLENTGTL